MHRALLLLAASCALSPAFAGTIAVTANGPAFAWTGSFASVNQQSTAGWSFHVGPSPLTVTDVGIFDQGGDGLIDSHELGIWTSLGSLLVDVTVAAGTGEELDGSYRFHAITPMVLSADTDYVIGAFYPGKPTSGTPQDTIIFNSSSEVFSGVTYTQSVQSTLGTLSTFTFPNINAGLPEGVFGPNFRFDSTASVPEPGTAAFLLTGLLGGLVIGRRRRRVAL